MENGTKKQPKVKIQESSYTLSGYIPIRVKNLNEYAAVLMLKTEEYGYQTELNGEKAVILVYREAQDPELTPFAVIPVDEFLENKSLIYCIRLHMFTSEDGKTILMFSDGSSAIK